MPKIAEAIAAKMKGRKKHNDEDEQEDGLDECAERLGEAIGKKNWKAAAREFRMAVSIAQE